MKSEGECFALAALATAFMVSRRGQRRPLLFAAGAVVAADLPWRVWVAAVGARSTDYTISDLLDPSYLSRQSGRVSPVTRELWSQIWSVPSWSHVVLLVVFALASAVVLRRFRLALFGAVWLLLSFGGLVAIYWISQNEIESNLMNSSNRTIASIVIGGGLLVPVLLRPDDGAVHSDAAADLQKIL
jgi:hypothetical protein